MNYYDFAMISLNLQNLHSTNGLPYLYIFHIYTITIFSFGSMDWNLEMTSTVLWIFHEHNTPLLLMLSNSLFLTSNDENDPISSKRTDIISNSNNIFAFLKANCELLDSIHAHSFLPFTILSLFRNLSKKSQLFLMKYLFIVQYENQIFPLKFANNQNFSDPKFATKQLEYQKMIYASLSELQDYRILTKGNEKFSFNYGFVRQLRKVALENDILRKQQLVSFNLSCDEMSDIAVNGHGAQYIRGANTDTEYGTNSGNGSGSDSGDSTGATNGINDRNDRNNRNGNHGANQSEKEKIPSKRKLEKLAKEKWEMVLHYMVGAVEQLRDSSIEDLLRQSNLVQSISEEEKKQIELKNQTSLRTQTIDVPHVRITNQGFQFLLQDTRTQIWQLFKQYLLASEERGQDPVEVMEFLFRISFMDPGQPIQLSSLTSQEHNIVNNLAQFGILYKKRKRDRVYPTQLASGLLTNVTLGKEDSGFSAWYNQQDLDGYILVETNFRVYAYTNSPLQIQLLSLFVELDTRIPNLVSGTLCRDSVRAALVNGITADQIISYLAMHAHPEMKKNPWLVPPNIVDQVRLWEKEKERVRGTEAVLFESFPTYESYSLTHRFAEANNCLLYHDDDKLELIVKQENIKEIKEFIKNLAM